MTAEKNPYDVVVVGGGAVGLFLACLLGRRGLGCRVLEQRSEPHPHSRSIGIHPPSLERFRDAGIVDPFLDAGVRIERGHVFSHRRRFGTLSFAHCPPPYRFVLSLPQRETERILEEAAIAICGPAIERGVTVTGIHRDPEGAWVEGQRESGEALRLRARFVVGCDGSHSTVRRQAGIPFPGADYPDTYVMGDAEETTRFGSDACIYLAREGLVESFPLPGGLRRWVVKVPGPQAAPDTTRFCRAVRERTGQELPAEAVHSCNAFGVQGYCAARASSNRCLLAGDAAHVMSPFGGQGMNVGWMDAWDAADRLQRIVKDGAGVGTESALYDARVTKRARRAIQRAEINLQLGREGKARVARNLLIRAMLMPPMNRILARAFTMRWM
jgi:2-polyprenyl-6-methoxyphenol hydroxylase-like FAD-dependent oxidoreductase